ncbi:hypothetical protein HID58_088756 [Brassica napus]|uniref:Transmembrane protein n=1 Tax=Brassica napus TaxID=3708 RepID=A0ABQ7XX21_BRANA|nr:hypothetical protein HID58_088756 [Brassica napus]
MEKVTKNSNSETKHLPPPNHHDGNVKQLKECSSLYLIVLLIAIGTRNLVRNVHVQALKACRERRTKK